MPLPLLSVFKQVTGQQRLLGMRGIRLYQYPIQSRVMVQGALSWGL